MVCYLPKATFYFYFGFFFVGYLWIFGILFINFWDSNSKSGKSRPYWEGTRFASVLDNSSLLLLHHGLAPVGAKEFGRCPFTATKPPFKICLQGNDKKNDLKSIILIQKMESSVSVSLHSAIQILGNKDLLLIDIGAMDGFTSLMLASLGYKSIAFDANSDNCLRLQSSVLANGFQSAITVVRALPSDKKSTLTVKDEQVGSVYTVRLDNLMALGSEMSKTNKIIQEAPVVILRLRVEGMECSAIQGATNLLNKVAYIFMQYATSRDIASVECFTNMISTLKGYHFTPMTLQFTPIKESNLYSNHAPLELVWVKERTY